MKDSEWSDFHGYIADVLNARFQDSVIKQRPVLPNRGKPDFLVYGATMKGKPTAVLVRGVKVLKSEDVLEAAKIRDLSDGSGAIIFVTGDTKVSEEIKEVARIAKVLIEETPWCEPVFH